MAESTLTLQDVATQVKALGEGMTRLEQMARTPRDGPLPVQVVSTVPATARDHSEEARGGFKSLGQFAQHVKAGSGQGGVLSKELDGWRTKAISGLGELVGAEGGFLVPPAFGQGILERAYAESALLGMCDQNEASGNSLVINRSAETSRATGSRWGGVRAYWTAEGGQLTASTPTWSPMRLELRKLTVLIYATNELLADATALSAYLQKVAALEIAFMTDDAIFRGTGAGQPVGFRGHASVIDVAKETGQAAATVVKANIDKMWSRCWAPSRNRATWLINQDVEPQLENLAIDVGTGGMPVYLPPGGIADTPNARLKGRPVKVIEHCNTLGTTGDIVLIDLSQYAVLKKSAVEGAVSMHLRFDYDEQVFRWTFRLDGQPWWISTLTPYQGSNTQSWAITLATRS